MSKPTGAFPKSLTIFMAPREGGVSAGWSCADPSPSVEPNKKKNNPAQIRPCIFAVCTMQETLIDIN